MPLSRWKDIVLNILYLASLSFFIIATTNKLGDAIISLSIALFSMSAFIYYINVLCSPYCFYFHNQIDAQKMFEELDLIFKQPPRLTMNNTCYHYGVKSVHYSGIRWAGAIEKKKCRIVTHTMTKDFDYFSWRDISGMLNFNNLDHNVAIVKLTLFSDVYFANDGTSDDYKEERDNFKTANKHDQFQEYSEEFAVDGEDRDFVITLGDNLPFCFGMAFYALFSLLPLQGLYGIYLDSCCVEQEFTIAKVVSTKTDLQTPEEAAKFAYFQPRIMTRDKLAKFSLDYPEIININMHIKANQVLPSEIFIQPPRPDRHQVLFLPCTLFADRGKVDDNENNNNNDDNDDENHILSWLFQTHHLDELRGRNCEKL